MNPKELIRAKRDGAPLDPDDLRALARGIADGGLTDAQVAAFAMAVFFRGLDSIELPAFTLVAARYRDRGFPASWNDQRLSGLVAGVAIAMAGALLVTGVDAGRSGRALAGDLMALAGGMAAAVYVSCGEQARRQMSTASYTVTAYTTCSALLLVRSVTSMCPGACVMQSEGFASRTTDCGVMPHAQ